MATTPLHTKPRILIVDDEESIRKLLSARCSREGWDVETAEDGAAGLEAARKNLPTVVISDIKMPQMDGFQMIEALRSKKIECPVIMITGHGEKECAIESIHKGAFDYLEKPFDMDTIAQVVKRAVEREQLRTANVRLMKDLESALEVKTELLERKEKSSDSEALLVGSSSHIQNIKEMAKTMADNFTGDNDPVVMITGESGVGKEMVARYLHAQVFDKTKPFVAINCAAFPDTLLESELFGYEKGAFTGANTRKLGLFELANGGTLFLDEIGEMDLRMQAKLLRVLQERVIRRLGGAGDIPVRPHIIAATNRDLAKMVQEQKFREDLYYRLNTLPLAIAPLRSRSEDIPELAKHFLKTLSKARSKNFAGFSPAAEKAMMSYRWPGNVRELRSIIERAVILEKGTHLELSQLRQESLHNVRENNGGAATVISMPTAGPTSGTGAAGAAEGNLGGTTNIAAIMAEIEQKGLSAFREEMDDKLVRAVLMECLSKTHGNVSSVARTLKLDRANLLRLLKRFQIEPDLFRDQPASAGGRKAS